MSDLVDVGLGILGYQGTQSQNEANAAIHAADNAFNAQQFATRYQTTVKDLQAAGLNPMLAYGANPGAPSANSAPMMQNAVSSGVDAYTKSTERTLASAQTEKVLADAEVSRNQAKLIAQQTAESAQRERQAEGQANASALQLSRDLGSNTTAANVQTQAALAAKYWSEIPVNKATLGKIASEIVYNRAGASAALANARRAISESKITEADLARAINEERMQKSAYGSARPYLKDAAGVARGVAGAVGAFRKPTTVINKTYQLPQRSQK